MSKQTGGPAFPVEQFNPHSEQGRALDWQSEGMTLRDYFAAKALPALVGIQISSSHIASEAYRIADLMIAERAK